MKRIAIILNKKLSAGQIGNAAAILMGQGALMSPEIYSSSTVVDLDGISHAGIKYSTVLLKAGTGQIENLVKRIQNEDAEINLVAFSEIGQKLNNEFLEYQKIISDSNLNQSIPVGIILIGQENAIKSFTSKFSLIQ